MPTNWDGIQESTQFQQSIQRTLRAATLLESSEDEPQSAMCLWNGFLGVVLQDRHRVALIMRRSLPWNKMYRLREAATNDRLVFVGFEGDFQDELDGADRGPTMEAPVVLTRERVLNHARLVVRQAGVICLWDSDRDQPTTPRLSPEELAPFIFR